MMPGTREEFVALVCLKAMTHTCVNVIPVCFVAHGRQGSIYLPGFHTNYVIAFRLQAKEQMLAECARFKTYSFDSVWKHSQARCDVFNFTRQFPFEMNFARTIDDTKRAGTQ